MADRKTRPDAPLASSDESLHRRQIAERANASVAESGGRIISLDPIHATDSGTDTFVSEFEDDVPQDGFVIVRDFQSASTTTTPTLDGKTMTTRDGSALWAAAVSGPHELQYDLTADTYLVLEPILDTDHTGSVARIATGTYTGDGTTSQSITGVGFAPKEVMIVKQDTGSGTVSAIVYWATDQIVDDNAAGRSITISTGAFYESNKIISLDADGFTVDDAGGDNDPNANGVTYNYKAVG